MFWNNRLRPGYHRVGLKAFLKGCLDVVKDNLEDRYTFRLASDLKKALRLVDEDDGYGYCQKCGDSISLRHLRIAPLTRHCRRC